MLRSLPSAIDDALDTLYEPNVVFSQFLGSASMTFFFLFSFPRFLFLSCLFLFLLYFFYFLSFFVFSLSCFFFFFSFFQLTSVCREIA